MRSYVAAALEGDYDMTSVESGLQALQALPGGDFDLVISDVHMPDIHGLELVKFMRASAVYRDVPLILISTEASANDVGRGLELGANAYLPKPFSPGALLDLVRRVLCR
jgi:CheY-like chemotaxis protein